jgi:hypothetical protein
MTTWPRGKYRGQTLAALPTSLLRSHAVRSTKQPRLRAALLRELNTRPDRLAPAPKRRPRVEPVPAATVVSLGVFAVGTNTMRGSLRREGLAWHVDARWQRPTTAGDRVAWSDSGHAAVASAVALFLEIPLGQLATSLCAHCRHGAGRYAAR